MTTDIRHAVILCVLLMAVQMVGVFVIFSEKYESRALIQIQPATPVDQYNLCNVETIRGLLERWDLDAEVRKKFDLEKDAGNTHKLLIPRSCQEADPGNHTFMFKFRHASPETAQGVVAAFLQGIERLWRKESEGHFKSILLGELQSLGRNLGLMEAQSREIPSFRTMVASTGSSLMAQVLNGTSISYPNPEYETLIKDRNLTIRRIDEINLLLAQPSLASSTPLRWTVLAHPVRAQRPVWPTRMDLSSLALINSLVWATAFFIWRRCSAA